jgi:hypothetical protein
MNIVFVAPRGTWWQGLATETRAAADAGHRVGVVAEHHDTAAAHPLDPRVEVRWIGAQALEAREPLAADLLLNRIPLGLLRRLGRGPLRRPADRAARRLRRRVLDPRRKRRARRTEERRVRHRIACVRAVLAERDPDWIVLHEPHAVEIAAGFLPPILDERPDLVTTFSYEPRAEASATHAG